MEAGAFWDREILEHQYSGWLEHPAIRDYANTRIGGDRPIWPIEWFERWLGGRKFDRALSIGCGSGGFERGVIERGLCRSVDAFDASITSLHLARVAADEAGFGERIRYFAADFNEPLFRGSYDIVFFHQSAHHVRKLEKLYRAVLHALRPDGLVYLDEYVGPNRHEWTDANFAKHRAVYAKLPENVRLVEPLPYPILVDDPSEAIRSSEIEPQLRVGFDVVAQKPYGGALLSVLFPFVRMNDDVARELIAEEQRWKDSYYSILVASPKRGLRKLAASAAYWLVPKVKRAGRDVTTLFRA